jgi:hypothetical protein
MAAVWLAMILLTTVGAERLHALPRFALLTGTRCSACHFNPQGSSIRTELGWSTMNETGAVKPEEIGLGALYGAESNSFFDGLLTLGLDTRIQVAKLGRPPNDKRKIIPMQVAPSIALAPLDELTIYGTYNAGPLRYPGQTAFDAAIQYQPGITSPSIRIGHIQPSIGLRYDDHTTFLRKDAAGTGAPVIAPNYNEWGAEVVYEGQRWLSLNAGIFAAHNLSRAEPTVDSTKPSYGVRVMLWPQWLDEGINGEAGASAYVNGDFSMVNIFAGIGLADQATLQGEFMTTRNASDRTINNFTIMASYQPIAWLSLDGRYEHGNTETPGLGASQADAFVVGAEFFPIPYVELRPEYRYFNSDEYILGQYSLQLHLFY